MVRKLLLLLMLGLSILAGCGRPVGETCRFASDCSDGDWCVSSLQETAKVPVLRQCMPACSSDSDCESGHCAQVGDGAGPAGTAPMFKYYVCAP